MSRKLSGRSDWIVDLLFVVVLLLSIFFFYKKAIFLQTRTLRWDGKDYFYPIFHFVSSLYRQGELPLWNPYLFNGFPSIGNVESQAFYPPNILFVPFSSFTPYLVYLQVVFHYFVAGISMYVASRCYLARRESCLVSAFTYMYSGFMIGHFSHITMIDVLAWFPLIFCLYDKALRERSLRIASLAGFVLGISILAGHPQSSHIVLTVLAIQTVYRTYTICKKDPNRSGIGRSAAVLAVAFGLGISLSAVQLLPTIELVKEAARGSGVSFLVSYKGGQLSLQDLVLFLIPNYYGAITYPYWGDLDITQNIIYVGVIPLLSVGVALLYKRKEGNVVFFAVLATLFFVLSLGENGFLYQLFFGIFPGANLFRGPVHWIICSTLFLSFLAGYGFDALIQNMMDKKVYLYLLVALTVSVGVYVFSPNPGVSVLEAKGNMKSGLVFFAIMFVAFAFAVSMCIYYPKSRNISVIILLLLVFADLYLSLADAATLGLNSNPVALENNPIVDYIQEKEKRDLPGSGASDSVKDVQAGLFRVITQPAGLQGLAPLWFNAPMVKRLYLVEGFEPLQLDRHQKMLDALVKSNFPGLLKICNVKYILSSNPQGLFEYEGHTPRFCIVGKARFLESDAEVLKELSNKAFDPMREVIISGKGDPSRTAESSEEMSREDWKVDVFRYSPNHVEAHTFSRKDGFLVFSDTYYNGWKGFVDGEAASVVRANYNFKALFLPKGSHTVKFIFQSDSFSYGFGITVFTAFVLIGFGFSGRRKFFLMK